MLEIPLLLIIIVVIALVFDYTNGAHDSANAIASVVSTRVMSPKAAVVMSASLNFVGACLGTSVAETVGKGLIDPQLVMSCQQLVLAGLLGAIAWNVLTWHLGLPSSSSHALIGGLVGAAIKHGGWAAPNYSMLGEKVVLPIFLSPLGGFIAGYLLMTLLAWATYRVPHRPGTAVFRRLQILAAVWMSLSHGMNDAQKTMGIIALSLFSFKLIPVMHIPLWVQIVCAMAIAAGTLTGGWKIIKTMGSKIFKMQVVHGFAAQASTAAVVTIASWTGSPISTTQVISSSILGVGAAKDVHAVRWQVGKRMVVSWFLTMPAAAVVGAVCMTILDLFW